jgi:glycosyltransferase involved in cell wall biosynthesis
MIPEPSSAGGPSGIRTVIEAYHKLAGDYGISFVQGDADISIVHAGLGGKKGVRSQADIAMLHGIYFSAEYPAHAWEFRANERVIENAMTALTVTVPSDWVAITLRKEFKIDPYVLEHGVFWDEWQHNQAHKKDVVFWGKNRIFEDVCDPGGLLAIADRMPDINFITTLAPDDAPSNVHAVGLLGPDDIKRVVQKSGVVLSTIKETWGLLYIEAMAAGTPVVTVNNGHVPKLVEHGVTGYHYRHNNFVDMEMGIRWCLKHRDVLSANAREAAKEYSWDKVMGRLRKIIAVTLEKKNAYNSNRSA